MTSSKKSKRILLLLIGFTIRAGGIFLHSSKTNCLISLPIVCGVDKAPVNDVTFENDTQVLCVNVASKSPSSFDTQTAELEEINLSVISNPKIEIAAGHGGLKSSQDFSSDLFPSPPSREEFKEHSSYGESVFSKEMPNGNKVEWGVQMTEGRDQNDKLKKDLSASVKFKWDD